MKTRLILSFLLLLSSSIVFAGKQECRKENISESSFQKASQAAVQLYHFLEDSGQEVAIIGRIGSDQSKRGFRYTHAGIALKDHLKGKWLVLHELNKCGASDSSLFDEGLLNFFMDDPFAYDVWVMFPKRELQEALTKSAKTDLPKLFHTSRYSALAHPFRDLYQNSNQWLLEYFVSHLRPTGEVTTRRRAQQVLLDYDFTPDRMKLKKFERFAVRKFRPNITLKDHDKSERKQGGYMWVSVRSVHQFLQQNDLLIESTELSIDL